MHTNSSDGPSSQESPHKLSTVKIVGYVVVAVFLVIVIVLMVIFCLSKYQERKSKHDELFRSQVGRTEMGYKKPRSEEHFAETKNEVPEGKINASKIFYLQAVLLSFSVQSRNGCL